MRTCITNDTLHVAGSIDQLLKIRAGIVELLEFGDFLQGIWDRNRFSRNVGHLLGGTVDFAQRNIQHPANIADRSPGTQGTKGDDLGDLIITVFFRGIFKHFCPAVVAEIKVDIRHGDASWI